MAYINANSAPTANASCDLFTVPPTQRSVEQGYFQYYRPISVLSSEDSPIEFIIPPTGDEYTDLTHTKIRIRVKLLTDKNEALTNANSGVPINNFLHSMFSHVGVELNQKNISPQANSYNYRAMIENLLCYGKEAKETHLTTSMFFKDTGSLLADEKNTGYIKRGELSRGEFEMESNLHSDIFNQEKYLLNGIQMVIKLYRSKPEFAVISKAADVIKYKIQITDATLITRKVKITPSVLLAHAHTLQRHSAKYPITRVEIKNVSISKDIQSTSLDNLFLGQQPRRIIVAFVDAEAYNGSYKTNPMNFQHFNNTYIGISTDSALHVTPLEPNYTKKLYMSSYNTLFNGTGVHFKDSGSDISYEEFANGYNLNVFDLTPDISAHESHWNPQQSGSLRIDLKFAEPLKAPIVTLIYAEFDNLIEIDRFRNITLDYSA